MYFSDVLSDVFLDVLSDILPDVLFLESELVKKFWPTLCAFSSASHHSKEHHIHSSPLAMGYPGFDLGTAVFSNQLIIIALLSSLPFFFLPPQGRSLRSSSLLLLPLLPAPSSAPPAEG